MGMNYKVRSYRAVSADNLYDLNNTVQEAINDGWEPVGVVQLGTCELRSQYVQTLVKYEVRYPRD